MSSEWKEKRLGEVIKLEYGKPLSKDKRTLSGKYPVYGANGEKNRTNEFYYDRKSIIVGRKGSAGEINLTEKRFWPLDVTYFVKYDDREYILEFLYNLLLTLNLPKFAKGVKPGINRNEIYQIRVNIPSLPEQQRIVKILDGVFEKIAKAKENAEKNLQNARELFESYLQSVFANPGDGWGKKKLGEVCEYFNGKAHEQCIDEKGKYIVINSKFISSNGRVFKRTNNALFLLSQGDIVMVLSDVPNGKALAKCYLIERDNTYSLNQRICVIRSNKFYTKFLYYQLNRNKHFLSFDNGENQTNLRLNQILSCPFLVPPISMQKKIADKIDAFADETKKIEAIYQQKLNDLEELKKSILQKAFNGKFVGVCS